MSRRAFSSSERVALYLAADGRCSICGVELEEGWHADHIEPFSKGGETDVVNGQALCPRCNQEKGVMSTDDGLRRWQRAAIRLYNSRGQPSEFLVVATPGAGKTRLACELARRSGCRRIIVVCPTTHLKTQWCKAFDPLGIQTDEKFESRVGVWPRDMRGVTVTYQQVAQSPPLFRRLTSEDSTFVIFDEIHHCGDEQTWGRAMRHAFDPAHYKLALSGTPFRPTGDSIPFIRYTDGVSVADVNYGYGEALNDEIVRSVYFPRRGGCMEWWSTDGSKREHTFEDEIPEDQADQRLNTALDPAGGWIPQVLTEANAELESLREDDRDAGGFVITKDQEHARQIARLIPGALVAVSDDTSASNVIERFKKGRDPWLVAVRMVSEGVDIPRLRVCVYATNVKTELYFRQAVGRVIRSREDEEDPAAFFFIPDDSRLRAFAEKIHEQRQHHLESVEQDAASRPESRDAAPSMYMPISSTASDEGVIFDAINFTPEEIRIATLIRDSDPAYAKQNPTWIARLLRTFKSLVDTDGSEPVVAEGTIQVSTAPLRDQKIECRKINNKLSRAIAQRFGIAHKDVNNGLNRMVGVYRIGACDISQLERRRALAEKWLAEGEPPIG